MPAIPPSLGKQVTTSVINWMSMVVDAWGDEWAKRDIAYEFSSGEKKESTDTTNRGFYSGR